MASFDLLALSRAVQPRTVGGTVQAGGASSSLVPEVVAWNDNRVPAAMPVDSFQPSAAWTAAGATAAQPQWLGPLPGAQALQPAVEQAMSAAVLPLAPMNQPLPAMAEGPVTLAAGQTVGYAHLDQVQAAPGSAVVQIGEGLVGLAQRTLGDASRWPEIFAMNRDQILNPEVILPGMVLRLPTGPRPTQPVPAPAPPAPIPAPAQPLPHEGDLEVLKTLKPEELAWLGKNDKKKFFAILKPAALEAERKYGVPWQVTLAQAALESGWARSPIGGYNIFGHKGTGPAGSVMVDTSEWDGSKYIRIKDKFKRYSNFAEALESHGKTFHNGYYKKALASFEQTRDPVKFAHLLTGVYATSPVYGQSLERMMRQYNLI
ncbi:MAG: glucosaminidase domain-containing protein [Candidatus Sericytochromatia bacterium]|nr:glucosaminidase domain-containing protein [Candidatus Sericytochromatia bacterium]